MEGSSVADPIRQYESELAEVEELLKASPGDASLLSIKSDLVELLTLTRQQQAPEPNVFEKALEAAVETSVGGDGASTQAPTAAQASGAESEKRSADQAETAASPPVKKAKKMKDFEVPSHLIVQETDTEAQKQRKRREVKALKNKWRQRKKELETDRKQQSWQSFQKKKGKLKDKSIFSTQDGDAKVGVVRADSGS